MFSFTRSETFAIVWPFLRRFLLIDSRQSRPTFPSNSAGRSPSWSARRATLSKSSAGLLHAIGWDVQRAAATLLGPGDIEVGTVAAIRIAMTSAVRVAAAASGLGQPALDHDRGGAEELAEERFLPTHIIMLGNRDGSVKKRAHLGTVFTIENVKMGVQSAAFCAEK